MCLYYWTLDDGRLTYKKKILNNVAHQKENSFGSKEKSSKLKALKKDAVELPLSAHYHYYYIIDFRFLFSSLFGLPVARDIFSFPKRYFFPFVYVWIKIIA